MKKKPIQIPEPVRACLWFVDPKKFDWEKNKELVVTQVLNRGTWEAVRWVYRRYGAKTLQKVVSHPKRGLWFPQALMFWLCFFKRSLNPRVFQTALIRMTPSAFR